jgi:class 3 adenylate cyclase
MPTTTFLFVDQVRSTEQLTRLGDKDAHDVRRALFDLLRQATQMAGGHEVDFTGDGPFSAFGGAAEGVGAAVSMQQLAWSFNQRQPEDRRLGVRIGLNTGEPLESEGGGYFGTAVVVAARLCAAAGGFDETVVSWDLNPASLFARACQLAGRDLTEAEWRQYLPDRPYRRTCAGVPAAS